MIIDKKKLIQLLVDKTGFEEEEVEAQLLELIKRVTKATEEGKTFDIEGFGTFSMEEGELQFAASKTLETEINNKYAGMKPIELIGAFKEPAEDELPDVSGTREGMDEDNWTFDEQAADQDREEEETPVEEPTPITDESDEEKIIALTDLLDEEVGKALEDTEGKEKQRESRQEPAVSQEGSKEATKQERQKDLPKADTKKEDKDVLGRFLVAAVIIIAVGITGFLIYDMGIVGSNGVSSSSASPEQPVEQEQTSSAGLAGEKDNIPSGNNSEPEQEGEVVKQEEQQTPYGLRGQVNGEISNGYTIVVHSLRNLNKAEENMEALEKEGFRALINKANVSGTMYYRVGIGQFPTVEAAQDAIDQIPEQYGNNYFIKRIQ